jgi:hypothetical protein
VDGGRWGTRRRREEKRVERQIEGETDKGRDRQTERVVRSEIPKVVKEGKGKGGRGKEVEKRGFQADGSSFLETTTSLLVNSSSAYWMYAAMSCHVMLCYYVQQSTGFDAGWNYNFEIGRSDQLDIIGRCFKSSTSVMSISAAV